MSAPRHSNQDSDGYVSTPTGFAIGAAGVDLRVAPRNRSVSALSLLKNAAWKDERVFSRRSGHKRARLKDGDLYQLTGTAHTNGYGEWAYGHGSIRTSEHYPNPYQGKGVFTFDNHTVAWTGDRFLGYPDINTDRWFGESLFWNRDITEDVAARRGVPAYLPTAKVTPRVTGVASQDGALGRKYKLVAATSGFAVGGGGAFGPPGGGAGLGCVASIISRATGQVVTDIEVAEGAGVDSVRAVYSDGRFIVFYFRPDTDNLYITSAREETPEEWTTPSVVSQCKGGYDLTYINENSFLLMWVNIDGITIQGTYYTGGEINTTLMAAGNAFGISIDADGGPIAVAVGPNEEIGLMYVTAIDGTRTAVFDRNGATELSNIQYNAAAATKVAIASRYISVTAPERSVFVGYAHIDGPPEYVDVAAVVSGIKSTTDLRKYFGADIRSSAWRVGDETFCWLVSQPTATTIQSTYHLVGGAGQSYLVGQLAPGEGHVPGDVIIPSVHPDPLEETYPFHPTTRNWYTVLGRADESVVPDSWCVSDVVDMDFMPQLKSAKFGAATYFSGAIVQTWDGKRVVESGWTQFPEITAATPSNSTGSLTNNGNYFYRVYACWRNAAGELFRSPALTYGVVTLGAADDTVALAWTSMQFTNKPDTEIFFEVYRTEDTGTTFYLVGRRSPNDSASATITFTDTVSDAIARTRPSDPHNPAIGASSELEEIAPLGCEKILAHNSRLWMAGGEIPDGVLSFSKLREVGEGMGWNDLAGTLIVDVSGRTTVSLAAQNGVLVVFQDSQILLQSGLGPDNLGNGGFPQTEELPAADGALYDVTGKTDLGIPFWSRGGPRLLAPNWQVVHIGAPVEPLAKTLIPTGIVALPGKKEIRWYTAEGKALLWDYTQVQESPAGRWAVWAGLKVAGAALANDRAALVLTDGDVLFEDSALDDDGGAHFSMDFATWELRPSEMVMGQNRVTRVGLAGVARGPHTLRAWIYYDGARHWGEYFEWAATIDLNLIAIRDTSDAVLVSSLDEISNCVDGVYRFDKPVRRRPFSTLRLKFSDGGPHNNTFEPHEVALDMGPEPGLAKVPIRTFPVVTPGDTIQSIANLPASWFDGWYGAC